MDSLLNGWYRVFRNGQPVGYVAASVLKPEPLPAFEIVSSRWHSDPTFAGNGAVIWAVEVRNNTGGYVDLLRVDFTSYDAGGRVVDTDFGYVNGLAPGSVRAHKGYATYFGTEKTARIQVVP